MTPSRPLLSRLRAHPAPVAAVALLALVLGVQGAIAGYRDVEERRETVSAVRWIESAEFHYAFPVTRGAGVWENGTVLSPGEAAYYRTVSDRMEVRFLWEPELDGDGSAIASIELAAHARGQDRAGRTYWNVSRDLGAIPPTDAREGLAIESSILLDPFVEEVGRVMRDLPLGEGVINWSVEARVSYAVRAGGLDDVAVETYTLPMSVADPRIQLPGPEALATEKPHATQRVSIVAQEMGWLGVFSSLRSVALAGGGFALLVAAAAAWWTDPARTLPRAATAFERERHGAWISEAPRGVDLRALPPAVVDVASLDDLVQVAADARARVVLDARTRVCYVLLPHLAYRYVPVGAVVSTPPPRALARRR